MEGFDKKILKLFKALRLMEEGKHLEPKFSTALESLARYCAEQRKLMGDTLSRISSVGDRFMGSSKVNIVEFSECAEP